MCRQPESLLNLTGNRGFHKAGDEPRGARMSTRAITGYARTPPRIRMRELEIRAKLESVRCLPPSRPSTWLTFYVLA